MKRFVLILLYCTTLTVLSAQDLTGAWEYSETNGDGTEIQHVQIITAEGFISEAFFEKASGKFLGTMGGSFSIKDNLFNCTIEYASFDPELVGTSKNLDLKIINGELYMDNKVWKRIDDGTPGALNGAWLISGRKRDGEIVKRDTSGPRKTMKILSGTRFQWIAYNTETKVFMGTGGGTYTTIDGKYTENIGFFSRDDSRVGASLEFNYELMDGDWHHSGLSSKGEPIYEIWSKRKQ
ncbi:membrane or secreted protein [Flagellimonas crocea]|uniref:membrane or secreted protein n=1 Tax=Flagellimonas crocea TaxID=3067311 RepID=UPI00296FD060|nr:membrane or secreted protein [Muricauda sp. DH64]